MKELPPEIVEQILIRLDVRDLIRFKSVSNSWKSLITSQDFIKSHLKHSYDRDSENGKMGIRRIVMSPMPKGEWLYDADNFYNIMRTRHLLGSSNGLVCVSPSRTDYFLINPETREVNKLKNPQIPETGPMIYGFGYDSSKDDYKVVVGFATNTDLTRFIMFTLKSNNWEVIGEVDYTFVSRVGILHNGAIHWVVYCGSLNDEKQVILSFDLSEDKFKEIPQPCQLATHLGTMQGCLWVFNYKMIPEFWVMNEYNVRESWELEDLDDSFTTEIVHRLKDLKSYIPNKRSLCHKRWVIHTLDFIGAPMYTRSLVSPHVCKEPNNESQETSITKSRKVPKLCLVPASSGEVGNLES